jgi:hypothetical protein
MAPALRGPLRGSEAVAVAAFHGAAQGQQELQEPGGNHGNHRQKWRFSWEKHGKNMGKMMEKAGKTVASPGRFNAKMMGKTWFNPYRR